MQLESIARQSVKVYNVDVDVTKYAVSLSLSNRNECGYPSRELHEIGKSFSPIESITLNINIPESKYAHIYKIFNKRINSTNRIVGTEYETRLSNFSIFQVVSMLNNCYVNFKPSGFYKIIDERDIIIERRRYTVDNQYHAISYRNMLTGDEIFTKYMSRKRHILLLMLFAGSSSLATKIISPNMTIFNCAAITVLTSLVFHKCLLNYYSSTPNRIIKSIFKLVSFAQDDS